MVIKFLRNRIWPWSEIEWLKGLLEYHRRTAEMFQDELYRADPFWFTKKVIELHKDDPRTNTVITGVRNGMQH